MKKILLINVGLSLYLFSGSLSSDEITKMVKSIKKERAGISMTKLNNTAAPFILYKPKKKKIEKKAEKKVEKKVEQMVEPEIVYTISAILNHAVFINKKWYKKGDKLGKYKVGNVSKKSVTLLSRYGNKILSLEKKKKIFMKLNKGYK